MATPLSHFNPDWSKGGSYVIFHTVTDADNRDIWFQRVDEDEEPTPFLASHFQETNPRFSPNGRYVAYQSNETARYEIYVTTFPSAQRKWPVSANGGILPKWSPDGSELFYVEETGNDSRLMVAAVSLQPNFEVQTPQRLFSADEVGTPRFSDGLYNYFYEVTSDPDRFIVIQPVLGDFSTGVTMTVVEDWLEEFR